MTDESNPIRKLPFRAVGEMELSHGAQLLVQTEKYRLIDTEENKEQRTELVTTILNSVGEDTGREVLLYINKPNPNFKIVPHELADPKDPFKFGLSVVNNDEADDTSFQLPG